MKSAMRKPVVRPHIVRVKLNGRPTIFGTYVSLRAAYAERAKLIALGWDPTVSTEGATS